MKSYAQYCGLAKALDHVGDRWTLLIVREMLVGPRRYSDIRGALPGIATNLLAERLRDLQADGLVERVDPGGSYRLTEAGRTLEPVVHELVRWGARWMGPKPADESFEPTWLVVALSALLRPRKRGKIEIHTEGAVLNVRQGRAALGPIRDPDAVVTGPPDAILGVVAGMLPLSVLDVDGDHTIAADVLEGRIQSGADTRSDPTR